MKKGIVLLSLFVIVFGFGFFYTPSASADSTVCERNDVDGGCNGSCEQTDPVNSDDCNGFCERQDEANGADCADGKCDEGDVLNSPNCDGFCGAGEDKCSIDCDPLGQCAFGTESQLTQTDVRTVAARIVNVILTLLGTVAVVIVLIGGFKWMTSQGSEDKVGEAKKLIAAGITGLIIVLAAYSISTFVIRSLQQATLE